MATIGAGPLFGAGPAHAEVPSSPRFRLNPDGDAAHVGDVWVTKTDFSGNQLGSMALHNFGHGVSIAVEPYNGAVYLWTEWRTSGSGFGTRVGRFRFVNGATWRRTTARSRTAHRRSATR